MSESFKQISERLLTSSNYDQVDEVEWDIQRLVKIHNKTEKENQELKKKILKELCAPHLGAVSMNEACGGCDGCIEMKKDWAIESALKENQELKRKLDKSISVIKMAKRYIESRRRKRNRGDDDMCFVMSTYLSEIEGE